MRLKYIGVLLAFVILGVSVGYFVLPGDVDEKVNWDNNSDDNSNQPTESRSPITIRYPEPGSTVDVPFEIRGEAKVFEGQLNYRVVEIDGEILEEGTIVVDRGDVGEFKDFSVVVEDMMMPSLHQGRVEVYDLSARTGNITDLVSVNIRFGNVADSSDLSFQAETYQSPNGNFEFQYPKEWYLGETITNPQQNAGVFGDIQSSWIISSFDPDSTPNTGGIPDGSIKIDFEVSIPNQGLEIDILTQCDEASNQCRDVVLNGKNYTRVYNEDGQVPSVLYISMNNMMMYRASAIVNTQPGSDELKTKIGLVDEIASTFMQK